MNSDGFASAPCAGAAPVGTGRPSVRETGKPTTGPGGRHAQRFLASQSLYSVGLTRRETGLTLQAWAGFLRRRKQRARLASQGKVPQTEARLHSTALTPREARRSCCGTVEGLTGPRGTGCVGVCEQLRPESPPGTDGLRTEIAGACCVHMAVEPR